MVRVSSYTYDLPTECGACRSTAGQQRYRGVVFRWVGGAALPVFIRVRSAKLSLWHQLHFLPNKPTGRALKAQVLEDFSSQLLSNSAKTIERFLAIQAMGSDAARADTKQLKRYLSKHHRLRLRHCAKAWIFFTTP